MKKGDAITLVEKTHLVLIECLFATEDYVIAGAYRLLLTDEGVTWLKGYHTPDEECVSAARTCQALREPEVVGVTGSTGPTGPTGPNTPWPLVAPGGWGGINQPPLSGHTIIVSDIVSKTTAGSL